MRNGRSVSYSRLAGVGQWDDDFNTSYGFDPFYTNAFSGDVANTGSSAVNPVTSPSLLDSLISSAEKLGTAYLGYEQAKDINELNMQLVAQGKQPIEQASIAPQVRVGIAPDTQKIMMYAALGLGAILLISTLGKRGN